MITASVRTAAIAFAAITLADVVLGRSFPQHPPLHAAVAAALMAALWIITASSTIPSVPPSATAPTSLACGSVPTPAVVESGAHNADARLSLQTLIEATSRGLRPGMPGSSAAFVDEFLKAVLIITQSDVAVIRFPHTSGPLSTLGPRRVTRTTLPATAPLLQAVDTPPLALLDRTEPVIATEMGTGGPGGGAFGLAHIPLRSGAKVAAILSIARHRPFHPSDKDLLIAVAGYLAMTLEHLSLSHRLYEQATKDGLTGVLTRRYVLARLRQELQRAARSGERVSILMVDLDGFKATNDRYGHQAGDALLRTVGTALSAGLRATDLVGRYGGDEFVVVLPQTGTDAAMRVAWGLRAAVSRAIATGGAGLPPLSSVTTSLGIATYPDDATNVDALVSVADQALYRAKRGGRNRVERTTAPRTLAPAAAPAATTPPS